MDHLDAQILVEALKEINDEYEIYENYSGRGMYGSKTTGIIVPSIMDFTSDVLQITPLLIDDDGENRVQNIHNLRSDSLGRSYIIY